MPRVLVLSASVGAGHLRAAEAVEAALRLVAPDAYVENHDVLKFTNAVFRRVYGKAYLDLVNRVPHVLGYFYDWLDQPSRTRKQRGRPPAPRRGEAEPQEVRATFLTAQPWDLVINTHFLPAEMIATLRRQGQLSVPQTTVCTDFETHRLWVNQPCDRYFTATEEGAEYLQHWGVPAADIDVTGIPVVPAVQPAGRSRRLPGEARAGRAIGPSSCSSPAASASGRSRRSISGCWSCRRALQLVIVCGRNEELKDALGQISVPQRHRVKVMGFTREIDELMGCADLVVSKPGGLTTSEALARGVAMVIVNPDPRPGEPQQRLPAGERRRHQGQSSGLLPMKLSRLLSDPDRLKQMRENARRLGHPQAAFDVVRRSLALIQPAPAAAG